MNINTDFAASLLDPLTELPGGLSAPAGASIRTRYSIYRNNVTSSLADALEEGFPVVRQLLGERYFRALAGEFVRACPPRMPILNRYGSEFPGYIEQFPPLSSRRWLGDVARVELYRREANDAADAEPTAAAELQETDADTLLHLVPHRHPSARWLASEWPVHTLWRTQTAGPTNTAESLLIVRPLLNVTEHPLPAGGSDFLDLMDGVRPLSSIAELTLARQPFADIPALLALLVRCGALYRFDRHRAV